jgi:hypothetical protein
MNYAGAERRVTNTGRTPDRRGESTRGRGGDANRDPISGAPGAHPVGTGLGAAAGGMAAGAAAGTIAGPVGTAIGAAAGAIVGGLAGKGIAEAIDPTVEEAYWAENYESQPHFKKGFTYQDYHPGYRTGWEARQRYQGRKFEEIERDLQADYERNRGQSRLDWKENRQSARAAWNRFEESQ